MPGPPVPPTPKIPVPASDLAATQTGERILLRWTLPRLNTDGTRLPEPPKHEVYCAFFEEANPSPESFASSAELVQALSPESIQVGLQDSTVVFEDVLGADALRKNAGRFGVCGVKALSARGKDAGFSNLAAVRVYPVPEPLAQIESRVTEPAIELRWTPPARTTSGTPLAAIAGYEIYRSETGEEASFVSQGRAATPLFEDKQFRFGGRYFYRVRTLAAYGPDTVESEDSATVEVAPHDVFAPGAPANLIVVPGEGRADLTWDASPAADLAGYFVYRSRTAGGGYQRLTPQALVVQSLTDTQVEAGVSYYYVVTAVDAADNESGYSNEVAVKPTARNN
ncbi:MAG: fibronectin type III domain-containing protein [Candidatus Acidiferrales bacterium]